jgi:ubiquinone/menaquinone biosynthesis C-methylase UbiE
VKTLLDYSHRRLVFERRVQVLADFLGQLIPTGATVLDVGAGDGRIAREIMNRRPDVTITGIDVLLRPECSIPVQQFDGSTIPFSDATFDLVMFVDVLHHTVAPVQLVIEAARVSRSNLLVKDHLRQGFLARTTLRVMDWVGNYTKGVVLPYNYLAPGEWDRIYEQADLVPVKTIYHLGLYPWPFSLVFDRALHFVSLLEKQRPSN